MRLIAAGGGFNGFVAAAQLFKQFGSGEKNETWMRVGMIADDMATHDHFTREFGKGADVLSGDEKRTASAVTFEQIEQCGSYGGIWAVIESERESG